MKHKPQNRTQTTKSNANYQYTIPSLMGLVHTSACLLIKRVSESLVHGRKKALPFPTPSKKNKDSTEGETMEQ